MSTEPPVPIKYNPDRFYDTGSGPVPVDWSHKYEIYHDYSPSNASLHGGGIGEPANYNGNEVQFNIIPNTDERIAFDRSYVSISGVAWYMPPGGPNTEVPATVSIPWHAGAALLTKYQILFNTSGTEIENVSTNVGHSLVAKTLVKYPRNVIESMDDAFFTPCIEEKRDTITVLSDISNQRATNHLRSDVVGTPRYHTKILPLGDVFDCLRAPAYYRATQLQVFLGIKPKDQILFGTGTTAQYCYYFVTNIKLFLCVVGMSTEQTKQETDKVLAGKAVFRESFYFYEGISGNDVVSPFDSTCSNLMGAIIMIPSIYATDAIGINPYQYTYAGTSSIQFTYGNIKNPDSTLTVTPTQPWNNVQLYEAYRALAAKMRDREIALALPMYSFARYDHATPQDLSPYVLFCSSFFPMTTYTHATTSGLTIRARLTTTAATQLVLMRIRIKFLEMRGDGTVIVTA